MVYCAQVKSFKCTNKKGKDGKISLSMGNLQNGMYIKPPGTSTATNKHPTRSFRSVGSGCRGAEALPKDLDEVGFFRQQTDKKGTFFHIFMLTHGSPNGKTGWKNFGDCIFSGKNRV